MSRACALALTLLAVVAASVALASEATVEPLASTPDGITAPWKEALGSGLRVTVGGKAAAELYPVRKVELRPDGKAILGARYGQIREGALVGIVRVPEIWSDFRGKPVEPGTYALRYAVLPEDGNHMGVSEYRDFLVLVPLALDGGPSSNPAREELLTASRKATHTNHPAIMSLVPVPAGAAPPSATSAGKMLTVSLKAGSLALAVVLQGRAEE